MTSTAQFEQKVSSEQQATHKEHNNNNSNSRQAARASHHSNVSKSSNEYLQVHRWMADLSNTYMYWVGAYIYIPASPESSLLLVDTDSYRQWLRQHVDSKEHPTGDRTGPGEMMTPVIRSAHETSSDQSRGWTWLWQRQISLWKRLAKLVRLFQVLSRGRKGTLHKMAPVDVKTD